MLSSIVLELSPGGSYLAANGVQWQREMYLCRKEVLKIRYLPVCQEAGKLKKGKESKIRGVNQTGYSNGTERIMASSKYMR